MSESVVSLDFRKLIESRGVSTEAADWLQKALHPAGSSPVAMCIPDLSRVPSVCMDFRPTTVIKAPSHVSANDLWDCCIWCPPGDATGAVILKGLAGVDFGENNPGSGDVEVETLSCQTGTVSTNIYYGLVYSSLVPTEDGPALKDNGVTIYPNSEPAGFRTSYRSMTASLTASSLNNQGTVYSTQFARDMFPLCNVASLSHPDQPRLFFSQQASYTPLDENLLNLLSPSAETRPAKDGVYMPLRLCGPSQPFVQPVAACAYNWSFPGNVGTDPVDLIYSPILVHQPTLDAYNPSPPTIAQIPYPITRQNASTGFVVAGWTSVDQVYLSRFDSGDTGYDNCSQGVTIFRGLSSQATITLQMYVGLEMIPTQNSPVRTFVRNPPPPDPRALQIYYDIANSMAVSYPAKYNALGALLPLIYSAARVIIPFIPTVVNAVRDIYNHRTASTKKVTQAPRIANVAQVKNKMKKSSKQTKRSK